VLKIPDVNAQTSKQQSKQFTSQSTVNQETVAEKDQVSDAPPLVQQMFDVCIYIFHSFHISICTITSSIIMFNKLIFNAHIKVFIFISMHAGEQKKKEKKEIQLGIVHN
jgi:hypothetical protein